MSPVHGKTNGSVKTEHAGERFRGQSPFLDPRGVASVENIRNTEQTQSGNDTKIEREHNGSKAGVRRQNRTSPIDGFSRRISERGEGRFATHGAGKTVRHLGKKEF